MDVSRCLTGVKVRIATAALVLLASFTMLAPGVSAFGGGSPSIGETTYGGRAFGVWVEVPLVGGTGYADTGYLPSWGGVLIADFTPVDTEVADATVFLSYTRGFNDLARSEVATADVTLLAGTAFEITSQFLYTGSRAVCDGASGTSEIFGLTLGGVSFPVSGAPNQVYSVPGVFTMIVNEQVDSSFGTLREITVNALHVWFADTELIVSSSYSSISCAGFGGGLLSGRTTRSLGGGISPTHEGEEFVPPSDFVTGGGWFAPPNSNRPGRVNFGFNAGPRSPNNMEVKGHLNLIDHGSGDHLKGVNVNMYARFGDPQDLCRFFGGDAEFSGMPAHRYLAVVCDYGEPGRLDRFAVEVRNAVTNGVVYHADNGRTECPPNMPNCGELDGGNIQLHRHH